MTRSSTVELGRRSYKRAKRRTKPTSEKEQKGTIFKYMSKTMNTQGIGSMEPNGGSKRKSEMVEDGMMREYDDFGSYGAQQKKLRLGNVDLRCQGYSKSKTGKSRRNAKKTVIWGGASYPDIRKFWNLQGKGSPRGVGEGSSLVIKTIDTMSVVF